MPPVLAFGVEESGYIHCQGPLSVTGVWPRIQRPIDTEYGQSADGDVPLGSIQLRALAPVYERRQAAGRCCGLVTTNVAVIAVRQRAPKARNAFP